MRSFRFGVVCNDPLPRQAWQRMARRAEDLGYATLLTGDHLSMPSAMARAVSAADATSTLRVGSFVLNNDFHHPLRLAQEAATVDQLTDGRLELGVGSGWAKAEYDLLDVAYERPSARASRLDAAMDTVRRAWAAEVGSVPGGGVVPRPVQVPHPPVLIGGQGDRLLAVAARRADIVGLTGVTLRGGEYRPTGVSAAAVAERVDFVREAAGDRFAHLEFNVQVDAVFVGDDGPAIVEKVAALRGVAPGIVAETPFALIGSCRQLVDKLCEIRQRIGISYYVVSHKVFDSFAPVVTELARY